MAKYNRNSGKPWTQTEITNLKKLAQKKYAYQSDRREAW